MPSRIDTLTDEHRATFDDWTEKWLAHGLRSTPLNDEEWERVRQGALATARFSGLPEPVLIRMASPLAAIVAPPVAAGVWSGVESGVWSGVDEFRAPIEHAFGTWSSAWIGGNHWAGWLAWISWFRDIGKLDLAGDLWDRFAAYEAICTAGPSVWHQFGDLLIVAFSDVPVELHLDANGESHREDGPAIVYSDGWFVNMWHGIHVPEDFFQWTVEDALGHRNAEVRRCALERLGWETLTDRLELVDECPDPGNEDQTLRLFEGDLLDGLWDSPARLLVVSNASLDKGGTRRVFGLPVPADVSDPLAAAALLFDVPVETYAQLARAS